MLWFGALSTCFSKSGYVMQRVTILPAHASMQAFAALCWDERPVTFKSEDEEQLWRFMLRRAGMHRVDFLQVLRRGCFKRIQAGGSVIDLEHDEVSLFLMVEVRVDPLIRASPLMLYT